MALFIFSYWSPGMLLDKLWPLSPFFLPELDVCIWCRFPKIFLSTPSTANFFYTPGRLNPGTSTAVASLASLTLLLVMERKTGSLHFSQLRERTWVPITSLNLLIKGFDGLILYLLILLLLLCTISV